MTKLIYLFFAFALSLGFITQSAYSQDELQIEWFCPRECSNINDGVLIGATVKNESTATQQIFFSITHSESLIFFQSIDDLVNPTNTTLDQSMVLTFQPQEERSFIVLYAAALGTHDLTMTAQILDGPFWQQTCRVEVSQSTEADLQLTMIINGQVIVPTEGAAHISNPIKAAIDATIDAEEFNQLSRSSFGIETNYRIQSHGFSRAGDKEIIFPPQIPTDVVMIIENKSEQPALDVELFLAFNPIVFAIREFITQNVDQENLSTSSDGFLMSLLNQIDPGQLMTVHLKMEAIASGEGVIGAEVTTCSFDMTRQNNIVCAKYRGPPFMADIVINKELSKPIIPRIKDTLCYKIEVKNNGPNGARNVTIEDQLSTQLEFVSFEVSGNGKASLAGGAVIAQWSSIGDGATETLTIKAIALEVGHIENIVFLQNPTDFVDPTNENNADTITVQVFEEIIPSPAADLKVTKFASQTSENIGNLVRYEVYVVNCGPDSAFQIVFRDTLPGSVEIDGNANAEFIGKNRFQSCDHTERTVSCSFDFMAPGDSILIGYNAEQISADSNAINKAQISAETPDPILSNNQSIVEIIINPYPDLEIIKTFDRDSMNIADTAIVTLEWRNLGSDDALGIVVRDELAPCFNLIGSIPPQCSYEDGVLICEQAGLGPGDGATFDFKVQALKAGVLFNTASISYRDEDPNPENNTSTDSLRVNILLNFLDVHQYSIIEPFEVPNSMEGFVRIEYDPIPALNFLNVYMTNQDNGLEDWVVQNGFMFPTNGTESFDFPINFSDLGFNDGQAIQNVDIQIEVSDIPLIDFPVDPNGFQSFPVLPFDYNVGNGLLDEFVFDFQEVNIPDIQFESDLFCIEYRSETDINIDLNFFEYPPANGYAGDLNACGPASVANSFEWMERREIIPPTISHRDKLVELSNLMNREDNDGVTIENFVQGKLAFIDKYRLPVKVEYQTNLRGIPNSFKSPNPNTNNVAIRNTTSKDSVSWQFLSEAVKAGKGVEIDFDWTKYIGDSLVRSGHHVATVFGIGEAFGMRRVVIRDDGDQAEPGGLRRNSIFSWIEKDGIPYLGETTEGECRYIYAVRSVFTQCYDPTITHYFEDLLLQASDPLSIFPIVTNEGRMLVRYTIQPNGELVLINARTGEVIPPGKRSLIENWVLRNVPLVPSTDFDTVNLWLPVDQTVLEQTQILDSFVFNVIVGTDVLTNDSFDLQYAPVTTIEPILIQQPSGSSSPADGSIDMPQSVPQTFDQEDPVTYHSISNQIEYVDIDTIHWAEDGIAALTSAFKAIQNLDDLVSMTLSDLYGLVKQVSGNEGAMSREQLIQTALQLIDSLQIQVSLSFQSIEFGQDSVPSPNQAYGHFASNMNDETPSALEWEWFTTQIDNDIPVILEFGYYDETGVRGGGHWVIAYGYAEVGDVRSFYFLDDINQAQEGGTGKFIAYWDENDQISFVHPLSGPGYAVRIETALTAKYDQTVDFMTTSTTDHLANAIRIAPNPVKHDIRISGNLPYSGPYQLEVFNELGQIKIVNHKSGGASVIHESISVQDLPAGLYFVKLVQNDFEFIQKIIKN